MTLQAPAKLFSVFCDFLNNVNLTYFQVRIWMKHVCPSNTHILNCSQLKILNHTTLYSYGTQYLQADYDIIDLLGRNFATRSW